MRKIFRESLTQSHIDGSICCNAEGFPMATEAAKASAKFKSRMLT